MIIVGCSLLNRKSTKIRNVRLSQSAVMTCNPSFLSSTWNANSSALYNFFDKFSPDRNM